MVGEEEKANSHTSSSVSLCSPQGCNCFLSSHLSLFSPFLLLACLFLVIPQKNTHHACCLVVESFFFVFYSYYCCFSPSLESLFPCVCVSVCAYCIPMLHVAQVDISAQKGSVAQPDSACLQVCAYSLSGTFTTTTLPHCLIFTSKKKCFCINSLLASSVKP